MERKEHWLDMPCTGCGLSRDDLIRLVVGMQWREMLSATAVMPLIGGLDADGGIIEPGTPTDEAATLYPPACDIVDERLGVR
jgi:hypothetical protein